MPSAAAPGPPLARYASTDLRGGSARLLREAGRLSDRRARFTAVLAVPDPVAARCWRWTEICEDFLEHPGAGGSLRPLFPGPDGGLTFAEIAADQKARAAIAAGAFERCSPEWRCVTLSPPVPTDRSTLLAAALLASSCGPGFAVACPTGAPWSRRR